MYDKPMYQQCISTQSEWVRCWERIAFIYFSVKVTFRREKQHHMANKHSFYSLPGKSSGCAGGLRIIGEGLVVVPTEADK